MKIESASYSEVPCGGCGRLQPHENEPFSECYRGEKCCKPNDEIQFKEKYRHHIVWTCYCGAKGEVDWEAIGEKRRCLNCETVIFIEKPGFEIEVYESKPGGSIAAIILVLILLGCLAELIFDFF